MVAARSETAASPRCICSCCCSRSGAAQGSSRCSVNGITFSDELGGFEITGASGAGTPADPFVLSEEITGAPKTRCWSSRTSITSFGNRVGTHHAFAFVLNKVVINRTPRAWTRFALELREMVWAPTAPMGTGSPSARPSTSGRPYTSPGFASSTETEEPYDSLEFSRRPDRTGRHGLHDVRDLRRLAGDDVLPVAAAGTGDRRRCPAADRSTPAGRRHGRASLHRIDGMRRNPLATRLDAPYLLPLVCRLRRRNRHARQAKFDKSKLPSRHVSVGPASAPHRSYYYAMGMTEAEIAQPFVGVATTWNEAAPCNIALTRQAQAVKKGVKAAGGTPREFTTITVTDGIAMGHAGMKSSLVSREIIADFVELTMRGHCYDALVGLAGCDKSLPGMMMAMVRLNVPSRVHLWRLDPAGPLPRPRRHRAGRVRGGRRPFRRQDERRGSARARMRRLPVGRLLRRPVHRQHHGLRLRGDRPGAARARPARRRPTKSRDAYCRGIRRRP